MRGARADLAGRGMLARAGGHLVAAPGVPRGGVGGSVAELPEMATPGEKLPSVATPRNTTILPRISLTVTPPTVVANLSRPAPPSV